MAIYKLKDVSFYTEGYVNQPINLEKYFGGNVINWMRVKDLKHGEYIKKTDLNLSKLGFRLVKKNNQIFKKNSIVWSKSGSVGNVAILGMDVTANRGVLNVLPNEKIHKMYLYYWLLKSKEKLKRKATAAVLQHLYGPQLMNEQIDLPSLSEQQKIIDIIEPHEKLFISYSNCVRIDSELHVKEDINKLIDIIEPLEKLILNIEKSINLLFSTQKLGNMGKINDYIESFSQGYAYSSKDIEINGAYKIFTIKNINNSKKYKKTNFVKNNLIPNGTAVSGMSGTIGTSGIALGNKWVSNQRTLTMISEYPLQIQVTIKRWRKYLNSISTGAVQKNITAKDILNLPMSFNKDEAKIMSIYYIKLLSIKKNIGKLIKKSIKLLIK